METPETFPKIDAEIVARLREVRHVALDMDGTIYEGGRLFKETIPFLEGLEQLGLGYSFVTNNSSYTKNDYLKRLSSLGIIATREQMVSSTDATLDYLRKHLPTVRRLYVLGTEGTRSEFRMEGYELVDRDGDDPEPDAVVVGFDTHLGYRSLCRAAYWISQGKIFLATHPDTFCPTDLPTVLVDCGAICAALTAATGNAPHAVLGKPDPRMLSTILERNELKPHQLAVVGDRLYTDVAMAKRAGAFSVLVLTGDRASRGVSYEALEPDLVATGLEQFGNTLAFATQASMSKEDQ